MKSVTLNASGISFDTAFNTFVTKVIDDTKIVISDLPKVQISLGDNKASELGIVVDSQVTIKPIADATDGSFTLEVGEVKKKTTTRSAGTKSSGAAPGQMISNNW